MKIKKLIALFVLSFGCAALGAACGGNALSRPSGLGINTSLNVLYWDEVEGASSYVVNAGDENYTVYVNQFSLDKLETGEHSLRVKAVGEGYEDSAWSSAVSYTKNEPSLLNLKLINGNTEYEVVGPGRAEGVVRIDNTYDGLPVTAVGDGAFEKCTDITEVILGDNVKTIGARAFSDCTELEKITFSESLASIGAYAFQGCRSLGAAHIPDGVTFVGEYAFSYATDLAEVTLPAGLETISDHMFSDCASLTEIVIPDRADGVGEYAFSGAEQLRRVTVGGGGAGHFRLRFPRLRVA